MNASDNIPQQKMPEQAILRGFIGKSPLFCHQMMLLHKLARAQAPILINGESGTGKELAARSCHYCGPRQGHPFVPVNCVNFPEQLIESELFGHRKGAFTDARTEHSGLVAQAEGGTLFLDEVNSLSRRGQGALLRFIQERRYRPVGGEKECKANISIIVSTNQDLAQQVRSGQFREDLYFRLNVAFVTMPPLRERVDDIPLLARHFLRTFMQHYGQGPKAFRSSTMDWLMTQYWPGNVRELENWVHRAFLLADGRLLDHQQMQDWTSVTPDDATSEGALDPFSQAKQRAVAQFEKAYLQRVLTLTRGNISRAAMLACKERRNLGRLIKKHGIDVKSFSP
ncbi:MAG: sigma-54 dependent transcriptional regulator [Rheinheimera sp.]|nr:sigma-54 dependent transcriptional regulator [Rheinheimera sp.]